MGALVTAVRPGSEAARQGITPGDVIVKAGRETVADPDDVGEAIAAARDRGDSRVTMLIRRGDSQRFAALRVS